MRLCTSANAILEGATQKKNIKIVRAHAGGGGGVSHRPCEWRVTIAALELDK